jgi:hypothetical protein
MFIERSAGKIRLVRTLFVVLAALPCAGVAGWAAYRLSSMHQAAIQLDAGRLLGVPVELGGLRHLRPGGLWLDRCVLRSPDGAVAVAVEKIEIETSAEEVRVRVPTVGCSPEAAAVLAGIVSRWLTEPLRFPRAWVIDVGEVAWQVDGRAGTGRGAKPVRVECVAVGPDRALRIVRPGSGEEDGDEVRVIVRGPGAAADRTVAEVHAAIRGSVPWSIIRAVVGAAPVGRLPLPAAALVRGSLEATATAAGWSGVARGDIDAIELADIDGLYRCAGEAAIGVGRLEWSADRLTRLDANLAVIRGRIDQALLDTLVNAAGCRPGPAHQSLGGERLRAFDDLAATIAIDAQGVHLQAAPDRRGALVRRQGLSLVDEPAAAVPFDRLAWLLAPTPTPAVPAVPGAAWLLSVMPPLRTAVPTAPEATGAERPRTGSTGQRADF